MWVPKTEADIQAAIENGVLKEGTAFDAKVALPPPGKNKDLAKDISAMTVDGGVLLYGVGGKDRTRPDVREPFDRAGAAERLGVPGGFLFTASHLDAVLVAGLAAHDHRH
jgi:hypothetical protein